MIPTRVAVVLILGLALVAGFPALLAAQHTSDAPLGQAERQAGDEVKQLAEQAVGETGHAAPSGHGEANTNPLEFRTDLALWTAVVFLALLAVLGRFAWGPICRALEQREQTVANEIAAAEKSKRDALEVLAQYERKLTDAKDEVRGILDQARREAEQNGRQIVEAARGEVKIEHQRALAEIENATAGAIQELAERSADLAVGLAGKIVRSELKAADHATLVERAVADFTRKKPADSQAS
jgi:F-type H+-transporting ATPase subunit b